MTSYDFTLPVFEDDVQITEIDCSCEVHGIAVDKDSVEYEIHDLWFYGIGVGAKKKVPMSSRWSTLAEQWLIKNRHDDLCQAAFEDVEGQIESAKEHAAAMRRGD